MLVRDNYDEITGEENVYIVPDSEETATKYAVDRLIADMQEVANATDFEELVSKIANLKEVIDLLDVMTARQVSIRQVNLRKKYGSYTDLLILDN